VLAAIMPSAYAIDFAPRRLLILTPLDGSGGH
jgi:hypothetical protein